MTDNTEKIKSDWAKLVSKLNTDFDSDFDLQGILFIIGVQELGQGYRDFSRDEKQDIMHIGTCRVLSLEGFYVFDKRDEEGWPHFLVIKQLPPLTLREQDMLLRSCILKYFESTEYLNL